MIERALESDGRAPREQRCVDHVAVADDPADVRGRPPHVRRLSVRSTIDPCSRCEPDSRRECGRPALGRAVVPEVARMYAASFDSITACSPEWPSPRARKSVQVMSRGARQRASARVPRSSTMRCSTESPHVASASSTMVLRSTSLPLRNVTSAAKTSREPLALMRPPSALAPKPANTTEWMCPDANRCQHQRDRLGRSWHVDREAVPFTDPERAQGAAMRSTRSGASHS